MVQLFKKILWATDFSDEAHQALLYSQFFARTFKTPLIGLHVTKDFSPTLYETRSPLVSELLKRVEEKNTEALKKLKDLEKNTGMAFKKIIIEPGSPAKKIIEISEREKVDLIVIGKRGQSAIEKLFIGSVANHVLRGSKVPVLMTKKKAGKAKVKKILVPTDFSPQEEVERDYAWKLAHGFGASLTLLHVLELHGYDFSPRELEETLKAILNKLKKREKREKEKIKVSEDISRAVNASVGIVDYAETNRYDLIVISTYVKSAFERFFLGSTAEKVISYSPVPVFAIPPV